MSAPTGTLYPGANDSTTAIGTATATGGTITDTYANITSSAILAIEGALGDTPQGSYGTVALALAGKVDVNTTSTLNTTINMNSNRITSLATPTASTDAATKGYVDANAQGLTLKQSVVALAASNVALSTGGLLTIDGVVLTSGARVLCVGQTTASQNGIYAAASGAWSRTSDANTSALVPPGMVCFVSGGTNYGNQTWALITPGPITLGTTNLTFSQFGATNGANAGANTNITALMDMNGPIQSPTQVNDVNGNAVLKFGSTAAAVNSVKVTNAATGTGPVIAPVGSDANITLNLNPVGTGEVVMNGSAQIIANSNTGLYIKGGPATQISPSSITGLVLWLKADAITGYTNGQSLATWTDASSSGNNATASGSAEPVYNTGVLNGLPGVTFNGTQSMALTSRVTTTGNSTIFWVVKENMSSYAGRDFLGDSTNYDFYRANPSNAYWGTSAATTVLNGATYLNGNWVPNPGTSVPPQSVFNIVSLVTTGAIHTNQITQDRSNSGTSWLGVICEVIIYNAGLTSAQRSSVEQYLANKWNLPLAATSPTGSPLLDLRDANNNEAFLVNFGGGLQCKNVTIVQGASYSASLGDYFIFINKVTGSATTVNLPTGPATGQVMTIKDAKGDAATNNITITPAAGGIDGGTNLVISTNYGVARLIYNGSAWSVL